MHPRWFKVIERHVQKLWFPFALAFGAGIDHFIFIIPTDGLAIGSILIAPRIWLRIAIATGLGSALGGVVMAMLARHYGLPVLEWVSPGFKDGATWSRAAGWSSRYGLWALFFSALLPAPQHPAIAVVALGGESLERISAVFVAGRMVKYFIFGWLASHAPSRLLRFKFIRDELARMKGEPVEPAKPDDPHARR